MRYSRREDTYLNGNGRTLSDRIVGVALRLQNTTDGNTKDSTTDLSRVGLKAGDWV